MGTSRRKTLDSDEKDWLRAGDLKKECLAHNQNAFGFFVYCKLLVLKEVVGANGFEPSTSWSRISSRNTILLARLALFCVEHADMAPYSAAIGLKSDPTMLPI